MSRRILILTQDKALGALLLEGLRRNGFEVSVTSSRKRALDWAAVGRCDFLCVDGEHAACNGAELCAELRRLNRDIHILMTTPARRPVAGADRCITPPLTVRKIQNNIGALLRADAANVLTVGDIELDVRNRMVRCGGREEILTPKEVRLLRLLMERAGSVVTRAEMMREVWDTEYTGDTRTVDVHIRWLRRKIEVLSSQPTHILTVRNHGYRFVPSHSAPAPPAVDAGGNEEASQ